MRYYNLQHYNETQPIQLLIFIIYNILIYITIIYQLEHKHV